MLTRQHCADLFLRYAGTGVPATLHDARTEWPPTGSDSDYRCGRHEQRSLLFQLVPMPMPMPMRTLGFAQPETLPAAGAEVVADRNDGVAIAVHFTPVRAPKSYCVLVNVVHSWSVQVFRCQEPDKGWGLRCLDPIPAGAFIACYLGEVLTEKDAEERGKEFGDEYLFNLDAFTSARAVSAGMSTEVAIPSVSRTAFRRPRDGRADHAAVLEAHDKQRPVQMEASASNDEPCGEEASAVSSASGQAKRDARDEVRRETNGARGRGDSRSSVAEDVRRCTTRVSCNGTAETCLPTVWCQ